MRKFTIERVLYSWEAALKVGFDVSIDNMYGWKLIRGKSGNLIIRNFIQQIMRLPAEFAKVVAMITFRKTVPTSQETHCVSITRTNLLLLGK
jgi:hypothetical protein